MPVLGEAAPAPEKSSTASDLKWIALAAILTLMAWIPGAALVAFSFGGGLSSAPTGKEAMAQLFVLLLSGFFGGYVEGRYRADDAPRKRRLVVAALAGALTASLPAMILLGTVAGSKPGAVKVLLFGLVLLVPIFLLAWASSGGAAWGWKKKDDK